MMGSQLVGTEIHGFHTLHDLDVGNIMEEATTRWLRPNEILAILCNYKYFSINVKPVNLPRSGTIILFDRKMLRNFRKDGHNWKKKKDGKTVKEAHEHLKVGNEERIHVYYAHGQDNPTFVRRCYWLLDKSLEHIVLVHYRETQEVSTIMLQGSPGTPVNSNSSSVSDPSPPLFSSEEHDSGANRAYNVDPGGNLTVQNHELRLLEINTLDWDELLLANDSNNLAAPTGEKVSSFDQSNQIAVNGSLHDGVNNFSAEISSFGNLTEPIARSNNTHSSFPDSVHVQTLGVQVNTNMLRGDSITMGTCDSLDIPVNDGLESQDSFGRWMNHIMADSPDSLDDVVLESSISSGHESSVSKALDHHKSSIPVQIFSITEVSPTWAFSTEKTKILVTGFFHEEYRHLVKSSLFCVCGDVCVPAATVQVGVYRCLVLPHSPGLVHLFMSFDGHKPISQVLNFEYRTPLLSNPVVSSEEKYNWEEFRVQLRLAYLLFSTSKSLSILSNKVSPNALKEAKKFSSKTSNISNSWAYFIKSIEDKKTPSPQAKDNLFELALKNRLKEWLLERVVEGSKKTTEYDFQGQGVIHLCAILEYTWAVQLFSWSGFSLDFRDKYGWTALHWAAYCGREKMLAVLLSAGAKPNLVTDPTPENPGGCTAADLASLKGYDGLAFGNWGKTEMREEVISSGGTIDLAPAASSAGASSPAVPTNVGSIDGSSHGHGSKAASLSCVGSQPPWTSLSTSAGGSAFGSSRPSCRPWERGDLLRRLATFKPSNWFGKPKVISSLTCAQRGWVNVDVDKIACESCGAYLSITLLPSWTPVEVQNAAEEFAKQLDSVHKVNCPWRGNSCPESLVQFPPTPQPALIGGYKDRCDGLQQFQSLPIVAASAIEQMRIFRGPQVDRFLSGEVDIRPESIPELESSQDGALCVYSRAQKLISLCGWEPRWLLNVQDCEEHSAQSARNGYSVGPTQAQVHPSHDPGASKKPLSAAAKKDTGKNKVLVKDSRSEFRSPLLDCSLCGATVRVSDFLTVPRPARFTPNNIDIPDASKKMGLTRGVSAASGISGWVAADDMEREHTEDRDEVATTNDGKLMPNTDVDLNLTMAGGLPFIQLGRTTLSENIHAEMGRDLVIGQPAGSEVGDRAASYESRGPSSRKRSLEKGGSSDYRPNLRIQQADSVEGTVIDRDGDEVTDGRQDSAGPSKRARDSDVFDTYCSSYHRDSSGAGPSHSMGFEIYTDGNRVTSFRQGSDQLIGIQSARDSTRASSVIAMDTGCHSANDSMESVENYPADVDDVHFPSSSIYGNLDINDTSDLNYSNQAQQSIGFQPAAAARGEMGLSSTNDGEEIFNAETVTAQARDGLSFGISGGSVGMCASHEAEIHGADVSVHRADSVVGDVEPRVEDAENQGQTGESAPDPGLMDEIVPDEMNREDPHGDSQEMLSRSVGRADSSSKIYGSAKTESVESGQKISHSSKLVPENNVPPSLSCNANVLSGYKTTKKEVTNAGKSSFTNNCVYLESDNAVANGLGPPKGESNYEEAMEFDPIVHHNQFCPWVNANVAAAGCSSYDSSTSADAIALCGWQLTLDALDALRSLGNVAIQTVQSESAASLYKDDHRNHSQKLLL